MSLVSAFKVEEDLQRGLEGRRGSRNFSPGLNALLKSVEGGRFRSGDNTAELPLIPLRVALLAELCASMPESGMSMLRQLFY